MGFKPGVGNSQGNSVFSHEIEIDRVFLMGVSTKTILDVWIKMVEKWKNNDNLSCTNTSPVVTPFLSARERRMHLVSDGHGKTIGYIGEARGALDRGWKYSGGALACRRFTPSPELVIHLWPKIKLSPQLAPSKSGRLLLCQGNTE
jgi:hypothetical protein